MIEVRRSLASLSVYRNLLKDPLLIALCQTLDAVSGARSALARIDAYYNLMFRIFSTGKCYRDYLVELIIHDDNPFSQAAETMAVNDINSQLIRATARDLQMLNTIMNLDFASLAAELGLEPVGEEEIKPESATEYAGVPFGSDSVEAMAAYYASNSRGVVSCFQALRWDKEQGLSGVQHPDPVQLDDLVGYDLQKEQLCLNTENFMSTGVANNALLYGSRGTGKSSMVKALLNEYGDRNLALVEIAREELKDLPLLVSHLREYPAKKFIIFIDDLSFEDYETEYKGLKAVMEGSLEGRAANVLLYATSNRRHLVREYFSDRAFPDEEIHTRDTMEEKLSLADRFGLTISFPPAAQRIYLDIVDKLAKERGISMETEKLHRQALEWERSHHGPSGRTAHQFIDSLG